MTLVSPGQTTPAFVKQRARVRAAATLAWTTSGSRARRQSTRRVAAGIRRRIRPPLVRSARLVAATRTPGSPRGCRRTPAAHSAAVWNSNGPSCQRYGDGRNGAGRRRAGSGCVGTVARLASPVNTRDPLVDVTPRGSAMSEARDLHERPAELLQRLLRFDTTNPPGAERECIEWIARPARGRGAGGRVLAAEPERPNLVARLAGRGASAAAAAAGPRRRRRRRGPAGRIRRSPASSSTATCGAAARWT